MANDRHLVHVLVEKTDAAETFSPHGLVDRMGGARVFISTGAAYRFVLREIAKDHRPRIGSRTTICLISGARPTDRARWLWGRRVHCEKRWFELVELRLQPRTLKEI